MNERSERKLAQGFPPTPPRSRQYRGSIDKTETNAMIEPGNAPVTFRALSDLLRAASDRIVVMSPSVAVERGELCSPQHLLINLCITQFRLASEAEADRQIAQCLFVEHWASRS